MNVSRWPHAQPDELTQVHRFRWSAPEGGYGWTTGTPLTAAPGSLLKNGTDDRVPERELLKLYRPVGVGRAGCFIFQQTPSSKAGRFLVENSIEGPLRDQELDSALFREFSELKETPEEILNFANRHGWLGTPELVIPRDAAKSLTSRTTPGQLGERLESWTSEIRSMKRLLSLWGQLTKESHPSNQTFQHHIRLTTSDIVYVWMSNNENGGEVIASRHERPELLAFLKESRSPHLMRRFYLQMAVTRKLTEHKVASRLLFDSKFERLGLAIVPTTLIGFLWLQFARAIQGDTRYRRCEDCGKWFEYGGQAARSDKRFCSATCRVRASRIRRREAAD